MRGLHAPEIVYSPDRLLYPLKRTGPKGSNQFERISWEEAMDTIVSKLYDMKARHGARSVCLYTGRGTFDQSLWELLSPADTRETCAWDILFPFGSPNTTGAGAICYASHGIIAPKITSGIYKIDTYPDIENSNIIVVWGSNVVTCSPPMAIKDIKRAGKRGAQVIVIDPRRTETVRTTEAQWIPVRPGTDGALALAFLHVVLGEGLYDREFADTWTVGFSELEQYVSHYTPELAETITGVPAETIRSIARMIATTEGVSHISYSGLEYTNSAVQNLRSIIILWYLTGNMDVPGGNIIKMSNSEFRINRSRRLEPPQGEVAIGQKEYPMYWLFRKEAHAIELPRAILESDPYPVRAMLVFGASLMTAYADSKLWEQALNSLDFLVTVDRYLTGDSLYADIVLPAATGFEYDSYLIYDRFVQLRRKVIEPLGECRSDWDIVIDLVNRLGYGHLYPGSIEEMLEWAFEGTEIDLEELYKHPEGIQLPVPPMEYKKWEKGMLRKDGEKGFETPSGKLEIHSHILEEYNYNPLPVYYPPSEGPEGTPELMKHYPLIFNSGSRNKVFFNSQHHNIPGLLEKYPHPLLTINKGDAQQRGISDGDTVKLVSPRGEVMYTAQVTEDIVQGAVEADAHGGSPVAATPWRETNVNELTDHYNRDPISGFPVLKALLCEVVKAE
jgi:anaerobic selenocysteine-containing dehydrogenase